MSSVTQLLDAHGAVLFLDAASARTQVGLWRAGRPALWRQRAEEAGTGLFAAAGEVLAEARCSLPAVGAFAYCEGPGSMLGIRTVAMALRTWQVLNRRPVYAYQSLGIAARASWCARPRAFAVIADARREAWHVQRVDAAGAMPPLQRVSATDLPAGELLTPEHFRAWATPPRAAAACSYDLAAILPAIASTDCFRPVDVIDAFQHESPDYRKWSAQVHSAATAPQR